eukprot:Pgem_evm1s10340
MVSISNNAVLMFAAAHSIYTINAQSTPSNWRDIHEGYSGYPAGQMLEIALRRTHKDEKLEMFKWRAEFIAQLGVQPGPQVEREWESISAVPANTGDGTWTGMTLWENQQRWHDMGNMLWDGGNSPVVNGWLKTMNMTLLHVKPMTDDFDIHTLAQTNDEVLEMGILNYPTQDSSKTLTEINAVSSN